MVDVASINLISPSITLYREETELADVLVHPIEELQLPVEVLLYTHDSKIFKVIEVIPNLGNEKYLNLAFGEGRPITKVS